MCEGRENFKVAVRVRPRLPNEVPSGFLQCVEADLVHNTVVANKPILKKASSRIGIDDFGEFVRPEPSQTQSFTYDVVLGKDSSQQDVFLRCASDIVKSVINGYNGSIIASGQTSSGKTYTIAGTKEEPGIIPRAAQIIFSQIGSYSNPAGQYLVRTSYLQIYNEKISDLLEPSRENLKIREDGCGGVFVETLSEHVVRDAEEIMALIKRGTRLRATNVTRMNKESSRSHAVFTIIIEHGKDDGHGGMAVTIGKLRLVDLAGSERLDVDAESKLQEETKNINVSLHNFTKVVTALTTPGVKYIPYRDSKLTRILQDCLGGNCKTTMIATIAPTSECYIETINTLKFAKRAKNIRNIAQVNEDMSEKALISSYQSEIKRLKLQLQERSSGTDIDYIKLLQERQEEQREKEEVKTKLEMQQKLADEAQAEKTKLISRIRELEDKFFRGGSKAVMDTEEFKEAILKEQQRVKQETASQYQRKFAELEKEKERTECEKLDFQKRFESPTKNK
ncbi:Kinesin-like protein KIF3A [Geodia barretti]|uniref:Kinesin-like protein n=1 Tax=Geodia barretti TaxID=519541 RepID=A0AA35X521_GEOBA|nr:Kinesin-like protein KIF3A [Geodia barretti]